MTSITSVPTPASLAPLLAQPPPTWDSDRLVCFLEPHLLLIKSRTLNAFYREVKYGTPLSAAAHLPTLVSEAVTDYRLESLLLQMIRRSRPSNTL